MDCLVSPVSILKKRGGSSRRLGYRPLTEDFERPVKVVVGKENRVFLVDPFVLEQGPFRVLIETLKRDHTCTAVMRRDEKVIAVDVDAILFEHMLWLLYNDSSSLFQLNVEEIIDFYAQDY